MTPQQALAAALDLANGGGHLEILLEEGRYVEAADDLSLAANGRVRIPTVAPDMLDPMLVEHRQKHHRGECDCPCLWNASLAGSSIPTVAVPADTGEAVALLHKLATAASIMLDSPEDQSANGRRLTRSVQDARRYLDGLPADMDAYIAMRERGDRLPSLRDVQRQLMECEEALRATEAAIARLPEEEGPHE